MDNSYRSDIDGIRAFAVVSVIIYHFNPYLFKSGYLGVDIFFVISGYVITLTLSKQRNLNFKNFIINFYAKRLRRLIPALVFFVALVSIFIVFVNATPIRTINTGLSSLFGISNIYLIRIQNDYNAQISGLNPFLHTWSLSVEKQFYLFYPIIIYYSGFLDEIKKIKKIKFFLILIFLFSFIIFTYLNFENQQLSYYFTFARFWEIISGALLFIIISENYRLRYDLSNALSLITFLILSSILIRGQLANSYLLTVAVVLLTNLLIFSLKEKTFLYYLFTNKLIVFIGKISYSLYLWHWGVFVLARWTVGINKFTLLPLLILIFLISVFSYNFIEKRFRYICFEKNNSKVILKSFFILFSTFISIFTFSKFHKNFLVTRYFNIETYEGSSYLKCRDNEFLENLQDPLAYCLSLKNFDNSKFFILGDSHAEQMIMPLKDSLKNTNYELKFVSYDDIEFDSFLLWGNLDYGDLKKSRLLNYMIENLNQGDIVSIAFHRGRLNYYRDEHIPVNKDIKNTQRQINSLNQLNLLSDLIYKKGAKLILISDIPLMKSMNNTSICLIQKKFFNKSICDVSINQDLHTRLRQDQVFKKVQNHALKSGNVVHIFDPIKYMKDLMVGDNFTPTDKDNILVYHDQSHILEGYAKTLAPYLHRFFQKNKLLYKN